MTRWWVLTGLVATAAAAAWLAPRLTASQAEHDPPPPEIRVQTEPDRAVLRAWPRDMGSREGHATRTAVAVAMDLSATMDPGRLERAKRATLALVSQLGAQDAWSLVTVGTLATTLVPLTATGRAPPIAPLLDRLVPAGSTDLAAGLRAAATELERADAAARHLVLVSDGHDSHGGDLDTVVRELRATGIVVSTIGLGDGTDETTLARLADLGGGVWVPSADGAALDRLWEAALARPR